MKRGSYLVITLGVLFALFVVGVAPMAVPPTPPSKLVSIIIGTLAPGTTSYMAAVALAGLAKKHTNLKVAVLPQTGDSGNIKFLRDDAVQLATIGAPSAVCSNQGIGWFKGNGHPLRLLHPICANENALLAAADTNIRTPADVRGKRVSSHYYGAPEIEMSLLSHLAARGLTYKDIVPVSVTSYKEGLEAVIEQKADIVSSAMGAIAPLQELRVARGFRPISGDLFSPEAIKKIKEISPGYMPIKINKKDDFTLNWLKDDPNIPEEIVFLRYWFYLVTTPELSDEVAYEISKAVWENYKELAPVFQRFLRDWRPENMVSINAFIPYHPGAIRWFKEKGVWTPEMEKLQQRLLAESVK
jgi:TRAP transporter TAXI family solute receptor